MTVDQARKMAIATLGDVVRGADPAEVRRKAAEKSAPTGTLLELPNEYAATLTNAGTAADAEQSFAKNIPAHLGGKPAHEVTADDIENILGKVRERGALAVERNLFRFLHAAFEFGAGNQDRSRRYRIDANPVAQAERPSPGPAGNRELWRGRDPGALATAGFRRYSRGD